MSTRDTLRTRRVRRRLSTGFPTQTAALSRESATLTRARLAAAAFTYSAVYTLAYLTGFFFGHPSQTLGLPETIGPVAIALGLAAAFAFRSGWPADRSLIGAGLVFYVLGAAFIDASTYPGYLRSGVWPNGLSWVCVWLVVFPLLVPAPPRRLLVAALAAASVGPLSLALSAWAYPAPPDPFFPRWAALVIVPYYICAATAWACAKLLQRLRRAAAEARELGSYQLEQMIGEGGMGQVWRARHRLLARPAAVKLLHPDKVSRMALDDDSLARRFEREARATAGLQSVHTVTLYDFGMTESGAFYYAMEYLEGTDLERLVERYGPIPPERAVHVLLQVCESLEEAHGQGLLHRDIKPSNVFLCRLGPRLDFAKVLDFGLVTALPSSRTDITQLTADGTFSGTPAYMPPEVALETTELSARSDLYSLGCVAYWMLTGRNVFTAESPMAVLLAHVREQPQPLNEVTEMEVPAAFEAVVLRCLAKEPADRPASARELADALRACGLREWTNEDAVRWWGVHGAALGSENDPAA